MLYILFSTLAFLSLLISDYYQISQKRIIVVPFAMAGYTGIVLVIAAMGIRFWVPTDSVALMVVRCILVILSLGSLVYILFMEIPLSPQFRQTRERLVVSAGTYSLVRHPAFYPFILLLVSLSFPTWKREYIFLSLYLILLDFLLILIEDKFIFPEIFANYNTYKKKVPFLFPGKAT